MKVSKENKMKLSIKGIVFFLLPIMLLGLPVLFIYLWGVDEESLKNWVILLTILAGLLVGIRAVDRLNKKKVNNIKEAVK